MPTKGITISVTAETNAGGRRHMEDYLAVKLCPNEELCKSPDLREQAFVGVFDGHGGKEAAKFARERLWDIIQTQPKILVVRRRGHPGVHSGSFCGPTSRDGAPEKYVWI